MPDGDQELIITAEGNKDYFDHVEKLINAAPCIDNWLFISFIPPRDIHFKMNYEGVNLEPEGMWFLPLENKDDSSSIGIRVCTKNYELVKDNSFFDSAVYKVLDILLGEKSAALDLHYVDFDQLPDDLEEQGMIERAELPDYIAWRKANE